MANTPTTSAIRTTAHIPKYVILNQIPSFAIRKMLPITQRKSTTEKISTYIGGINGILTVQKTKATKITRKIPVSTSIDERSRPVKVAKKCEKKIKINPTSPVEKPFANKTYRINLSPFMLFSTC